MTPPIIQFRGSAVGVSCKCTWPLLGCRYHFLVCNAGVPPAPIQSRPHILSMSEPSENYQVCPEIRGCFRFGLPGLQKIYRAMPRAHFTMGIPRELRLPERPRSYGATDVPAAILPDCLWARHLFVTGFCSQHDVFRLILSATGQIFPNSSQGNSSIESKVSVTPNQRYPKS